MKAKILFVILAAALVALPGALGQGTFSITDVDVDEPVAPGETLEIVVTVENTDTTDNVEQISWEAAIVDPIGGTEFIGGNLGLGNLVGKVVKGDVEWKLRHAENPIRPREREFTISVPVPADLEEGDYELRVAVEGEWEFTGGEDASLLIETFDVERADHSLHISDARAASSVATGETLTVAVDLLNNGNNEEPSVTVSASAGKLDAETLVTLLSPLAESVERTVYLALEVPEDAKAGLYELTVEVSNDKASTSKTMRFLVEEAEVEEEVPATPQTTDVSASLEQGKSAAVSITVTNNANTAKTYDLSVGGTRDWASNERVDPTTVTVPAKGSKTVNVFMVPTASGDHTATLFVKENGNIVSFVNINADVAEAVEEDEARTVDTTQAVSWLFIALVVILAVVAAVWAAVRQKGNGEGRASVYY